jgi:malonyl-CoA/methylmalonyl-CoA synthetase
VAEVAVAGRPDPDLGERVVAWVVRTPGIEATADELRAHVGGLLASHKRPRDFHFVDELPRNEMGKVVKKALQGD